MTKITCSVMRESRLRRSSLFSSAITKAIATISDIVSTTKSEPAFTWVNVFI